MLKSIICLFLKLALYAIIILENHLPSFRGWSWREMEWKTFGNIILVSIGNVNLSSYLIKSINLTLISTVLSLQELCCRAIVACTTVYGIEALLLPSTLKSYLKSYSSMTSYNGKSSRLYHYNFHTNHKSYKDFNNTLKKKAKALFSCDNGSQSYPSNIIYSHSRNHHNYRNNRDHKNCAIS